MSDPPPQIAWGREFAALVDADPRFELAAPAPFSVVCFRYKGTDEQNQRLLERINASGDFFLSHTVLNGRYVLRLAIGNMRHHARARCARLGPHPQGSSRAVTGQAMNRRTFLKSMGGVAAAPLAAAPNRPNVLLILSDQYYHSAMGAAGNPVIKTPALDRLAREGVRFRTPSAPPRFAAPAAPPS